MYSDNAWREYSTCDDVPRNICYNQYPDYHTYPIFSCCDFQFAEAPAIPTYVSSGTTPTLTPTTLASIEQSFIELSSLATTSTTSTASYSAQDLSRQSGFVPPVINPSNANMGIKTEYYSDEYEDSDPEWMPPTGKRMRGADGNVIEITPHGSPASTSSTPGPRRHTGPRPRKNENVSLKLKKKQHNLSSDDLDII